MRVACEYFDQYDLFLAILTPLFLVPFSFCVTFRLRPLVHPFGTRPFTAPPLFVSAWPSHYFVFPLYGAPVTSEGVSAAARTLLLMKTEPRQHHTAVNAAAAELSLPMERWAGIISQVSWRSQL
jgi:hypothetical protein